jgi:hypothetical protein
MPTNNNRNDRRWTSFRNPLHATHRKKNKLTAENEAFYTQLGRQADNRHNAAVNNGSIAYNETVHGTGPLPVNGKGFKNVRPSPKRSTRINTYKPPISSRVFNKLANLFTRKPSRKTKLEN